MHIRRELAARQPAAAVKVKNRRSKKANHCCCLLCLRNYILSTYSSSKVAQLTLTREKEPGRPVPAHHTRPFQLEGKSVVHAAGI